jgi:general secretion pathway protein I
MRGFTLIEVLIALAILAIALAASVRAASVATDGALDVRERMLATWIAQDHLAALVAFGNYPNVGSRTGEVEQANLRFRWEELTSSTPNSEFRRVEVRVSAERKPDYVIGKVVGFVRNARAN